MYDEDRLRVCSGSFRGGLVTSLSGWILGWRASRSYLTLKLHQFTSGAFLGVLIRWWTYASVREVICDLSEVPVCLSFKEGLVSNCCSMSIWGSESRSQQMVYRSIYSEIQGDSKQKSVVGVCLMIWNSITWRNSSCNDVWSWVGILWIEANLFLPISGTV